MFQKTPDFDVLSEEPEKAATILKERLEDFDYKGIKIIKRDGIGEVVAPHFEIKVKIGKIEETVAFIYKPLACHSYNVIKKGNKSVRVATIDTMLSFYFSFYYSDRDYYDEIVFYVWLNIYLMFNRKIDLNRKVSLNDLVLIVMELKIH